LYCPSNNIKVIKSWKIRLTWYRALMQEMRNANKILIGKSEGKRPLEISRFRWIL